MYFPGDPLFGLDPIFQSILDPAARQRLIARYDHDLTEPEYATGYRWDIVVCGARRTLDRRGWLNSPARQGKRSVPSSPWGSPVTATWWRRAHAAGRPAARHRLRRRRPRRAGRAGGTVAARRRRPHTAAGRLAAARRPRRSPDGAGPATDAAGHYSFTTVAPGSATAGLTAVLRSHRLRAGAAEPVVHPGLPAATATSTPTRLLAAVRRRRAAAQPAVRRRKRRCRIPCSTSTCRARTRRCSWRTGTTGDDQPAVAGRPPGRRAHDGPGGAAVHGRGGIGLAGRPGRRWRGAARAAPARTCRACWPTTTPSRWRVGAEGGGNPVIGLVALLRQRAAPAVAPWIHRGLTSQDVAGHRPDAGRARRGRPPDIASGRADFGVCRGWPRPTGPRPWWPAPSPSTRRPPRSARRRPAGWTESSTPSSG